MSWYLIELPDGTLTPYAAETDSGTVYGWGDMPKRKVDLDELLRIADDLEEELDCPDYEYCPNILFAEDVLKFEREMAARIRKAVGHDTRD